MAEREILMGKVLLKLLSDHPEQHHRAVWSWPERDKLSSQWLLCLPSHDATLTTPEFSECIAILCSLSPHVHILSNKDYLWKRNLLTNMGIMYCQ